ncbi:hypothetical protein [Nonomuraea sp. NPDC049480]|uniref:hypothetical protein n=1 Tax=Nonomuraea sp. NPDC049480 TaxID=3364353 RepID=UPI00378A4865
MIENKKGRPGGGDLSTKIGAGHEALPLQGTSDQPSQATAPVGGLRYPAPGGDYVAKYADGETWPVVGFDLRGNPLINVAGEILRADAFPLYEAQGFAGLLAGTYKTGSTVEALGVAA